MKQDKSIVIGCDNSNSLPYILTRLKGELSYNCISASRISDLLNIIKTINPILIILFFRNNQSILDNLGTFLKDLKIPILCLTKPFEDDSLFWKKNCIVFTQSYASSIKGNYLSIRINSIIRLIKSESKKVVNKSLAYQAQQSSSMHRDKHLGRYVLELDQKVKILLKVKDNLVSMYPKVDTDIRYKLISIVNSIKSCTGNTKRWDDFRMYFETIDEEFLKQLSKKHPSLTSKDLKYCCYLKMNMSNNDIRHLLGINQESVRTHKYRLKKKMNLSKEQDLRNYTNAFPLKKVSNLN